jgi:hypothetical protein
MQVPRLMAPGLTFGAALSSRTHDRPRASVPVTTRLIGLGSSAIVSFPYVSRQFKYGDMNCHPSGKYGRRSKTVRLKGGRL